MVGIRSMVDGSDSTTPTTDAGKPSTSHVTDTTTITSSSNSSNRRNTTGTMSFSENHTGGGFQDATSNEIQHEDDNDDDDDDNDAREYLLYKDHVSRLHRMIEWIQRQQVPPGIILWLSRWKGQLIPQYFRRQSNHPSSSPSSPPPPRPPPPGALLSSVATTTTTTEPIYLVTGLDRVVYGTVAAADAIRIAGIQPPRYLWYMLSGAGCDILQLIMDMILHFLFGIHDASICWAVSFFLSIVFRHTSHRYLVFGDYVGGYRKSLLRMYAAYSIIIVLSTLFNILMVQMASISHYLAWILTLLWTGIANYFILKRIWTFGGGSSSSSSPASLLPMRSSTTKLAAADQHGVEQ